MKLARRTKQAAIAAAALGGLMATALGWLLHGSFLGLKITVGREITATSYDLLMVARGDVAASEAVIVYLDEVSHQELGQPQNAPWDRVLHARLIERLTQAGARAVVFDILFSDPNPDKRLADEQLVQAVKRNGRVILGAENIFIGPESKQVIPPFPQLTDAAASIGSVELSPDGDLAVRKHTPENPKYDQIPCLAWATAEQVGARAVGDQSLRYAERWMNYYGPPNFIPSQSYYLALDTNRVSDDFFRGKVVFVGARLMTKFSGDRKDEYRSPHSFRLSDRPFMAGVEIQATMFLNLLRGDWVRRWSAGTELTVLIVVGLAFGAGLVWLRPILATLTTLAAGLVLVCGVYLLLLRGLTWFPWLITLLQLGVALAWSLLFNSIQLYVQKRISDHTLGLYLSPKLVKKFSSNPRLLEPGAEEQELTIFFTDIADFTDLSQQISSEQLAALMNRYFESAVGECIHRTDGTVVKYIGDAIFAFWNAPDHQADHARRACEAALLFKQLPPQMVLGRPLHTRIGIHTGVAHVGNFGSVERVDYTALGESVNLASRLEGLNKYLGTDCLISQATWERAGDKLISRPLGQFQLKGFDRPFGVFELVGWPEQAAASRQWRETFAQALSNFEQRNLEFAEAGFRQVLEEKPGDGPANFYLKRMEELRAQELPEMWATHTILRDK